MSTLFEELCKDAKADLDSGIFLKQENVNPEVTNEVDEIEKKMQETMSNATQKIIDAVNAANDKQVPAAETNANTESNNNQEVTENGNN